MDRIHGYEPGRWIQARHRIAGAHGALFGPYLVLEALAQVAGWLIATSTGFTRRGLPLSIRSIRLTSPVQVGDTVLLEAKIVAWRDESALVRGRASVDGRPLAEIEEGLCVLIPAERLEDPEQTKATFSLLLSGRGADSPGVPAGGWSGTAGTIEGARATPTEFDQIEKPREGRRARAILDVGMAEGYFRDHFPCLPIMPGALQLQAMVELARPLANAEPSPRLALKRLTEVKFRRFVRPGDRLVLEAEALSLTSKRAIIGVEGLVEGKRVASIKEVHFGLGAPPGGLRGRHSDGRR